MALLDLQFEEDEEAQEPQAPAAGRPSPIELTFEDDQPAQEPSMLERVGEVPGQAVEAYKEFYVGGPEDEGREPLPTGVTGYAEPVERSMFQAARDAFREGYAQFKLNTAQQVSALTDKTPEERISAGARMKELQRDVDKYGASLETQRRLSEISEANSMTEALELMVRYPDATATVTLQSLGRFAPALAVTAGVGAVSGGATTPLVASTFMGSLGVEYGAVVDETIREAGFDPEDPRSWSKTLDNQELMDKARDKALTRGIPIAVFDALSMGIAGKLLAGAKPTVSSIVGRGTAELGVQAGAGGAGEYTAQIAEAMAEGKSLEQAMAEVKPGEVALEFAAEIAPGAAEIGIGYQGAKQQALRRQMAEQARLQQRRIDAGIDTETITPDFAEPKSLEENEGEIDRALAAAPDPEIAPAVEPKDVPLDEGIEEVTEAEPLPESPEDVRAWAEQQVRQMFPDATDEEIIAVVDAATPEEIRADLGEPPAITTPPAPVAPVETAPTAPAPEAVTPIEEVTEVQPAAPAVGTQDQITPTEIEAATEPVESREVVDVAENYRAASPEFSGLILSFKPGQERNGRPVPHYYGEIAETQDADGMPVDVVLNRDHDPVAETPVFIVDVVDRETGTKFEQHKVMAGFDTPEAAQQAYIDQWGAEGFGGISGLAPAEFEQWIKSGDTKTRFGPEPAVEAAPEPAPEPEPELTPEEQQAEAAAIRSEEQRIRQTEVQKGRLAPDPEVDDAVTFLRKLGGINVENQSDIPENQLEGLNEVQMVGLPNIAQKGDKGLSLSEVTEQLWQAGYIADNDERLAINLMLEAKSGPQYTALGGEAQIRAETEAELERQAEEWADFVDFSEEFSEVDPETARLMSLAEQIDPDKMVDIASLDIPEADVQAQLQAFIDESKTREVGETAPAARPEDEARPTDEAREESAQAEEDLKKTPTALEEYEEWEYKVENFPTPAAPVNHTKVPETQYLSQAEVSAIQQSWLDHAERIAAEEDHSNEVVISLFDYSANMALPWAAAGYDVYQLDIKLEDDLMKYFPTYLFEKIKDEGKTVHAILAQPPCTCFSSSGARWWQERHDKADKDMVNKMFGADAAEWFETPKGYNKMLVSLVDVAIEFTNPNIFMLENPIGRIGKEMGLPNPTLRFQPNAYGDPYTKQTQIFGKFNPDLPLAPIAPSQGSLMHKLWSDAEKSGGQRSLTPEGFAWSFFMANNTSQVAYIAPGEQPAVAAPAEEQVELVPKTEAEVAEQEIVDERIRREEAIPEERPAEAQAADDLFAAGGQLPPDLFAQPEPTPEPEPEPAPKPKKKKKPEVTPVDEMSKEELEAELGYGTTFQDEAWLRERLERRRAEPEPEVDILEEPETPVDAHIQEIEDEIFNKARFNAMPIPHTREDGNVQATEAIEAYEAGLRAAGWTPFMIGKGEFFHKNGAVLFTRSQGELAAPLVQYEPASAKTILDISRAGTATSTPLSEIELTAEVGEESITDTAENWLDAIDERIAAANELRTCV